ARDVEHGRTSREERRIPAQPRAELLLLTAHRPVEGEDVVRVRRTAFERPLCARSPTDRRRRLLEREEALLDLRERFTTVALEPPECLADGRIHLPLIRKRGMHGPQQRRRDPSRESTHRPAKSRERRKRGWAT